MKQIISILLVTLIFCIPVFSQGAEKIQEFENITCEDYLMRINGAAMEAQNDPTASVYIFVYEGKENVFNSRKHKMELMLPAIGSAKAKINSIKDYLSIFRGYSIENFTFIEAGFRENLTVEIWRVPASATPPKSSPTLKKIKHRKGKAQGFCLGCC